MQPRVTQVFHAGIGALIMAAGAAGAAGAPRLVLVGPALDLSTDTCPTRIDPDVAYNSDADEYLVVWADRRIPANFADIYGQRIGAGGTLIGANIPVLIKPEPQINPSIAYSSRDGRFLVTWRTQEPGFFNSARGSILSAPGSPVSADFYVSNVGTDGAVAFRSGDGSFAHVGRGASILFQPVASTGGVIGFPTTVSTSGAPAGAIAYNPVADECLVAWRNQTAQKLLARRVSSAGTMIGGALTISPAFPSSSFPAASIVHRATDDRYLVTFGLFQASGIYGQWVSGSGALIGSNFVIVRGTPTGANPIVAHDPNRNVFLMTWREQGDLRAQMLDGSGVVLGERVSVATETVAGDTPRVVHNPTAGEFLVVWEDHRNVPQGKKTSSHSGSP